jgi:alkylation response protein AidB-like acyl-CoA dehydrogenase
MSGIDPDAGIHVVAVEETPAPEAVAHGRRAVAHQIAGATRTMVELARQHAVDRVQFGRPIARFQAVRHRLAEALVALEALDATLAAAASDPSDTTAALAKITAGQTARTVAAHCQQVLAGVGFTTDHPFHRYLKRTLLLDGLFGRADEIVVALGHELLAARAVPTLIDL